MWKPAYPEVDVGHQLANRLVHSWVPWRGYGTNIANLVTRDPLEGTINGTNLGWAADTDGWVLKHNSADTASYVSGATGRLNYGFFDRFTLCFSIYLPDLTTRSIIAGTSDTGVTKGIQVDVNYPVNGCVRFVMRDPGPSSGAIDISSPTNALTVGWNTIVITNAGTTLASGCAIYINGKQQTLTVTTNTWTTGDGRTGNALTLGRSGLYTGVGGASGVKHAAFHVWNRPLNHAEQSLLHHDPYVMLRPQPLLIPRSPFPTTDVLESLDYYANATPPPRLAKLFATTNDLRQLNGQIDSSVAGASAHGYYTPGTYGPNSECWARIDTVSATDQDFVVVGIRVKDAPGATTYDDYRLLVRYRSTGTDEWEIHRVDNGTQTIIASATYDLANGDIVLIQGIGTTLKGFVIRNNLGREILVVDDATYAAAGYLGLGVKGQSFKVGDFGGGNATTFLIVYPTLSYEQQLTVNSTVDYGAAPSLEMIGAVPI